MKNILHPKLQIRSNFVCSQPKKKKKKKKELRLLKREEVRIDLLLLEKTIRNTMNKAKGEKHFILSKKWTSVLCRFSNFNFKNLVIYKPMLI